MIRFVISRALATLSAGFALSFVPASAATITATPGGQACSGGQCSLNAFAHTISFDGLDGAASPYSSGIATFSFVGDSPFVTGDKPGYVAPLSDTTTFLTIGSPHRPEAVTVTFASPITYYGLYIGTPDTYNLIEFFKGGTLVTSFYGDDLLPPGDGSPTLDSYVNFNVADGTVDRIVLSSPYAAFESDNHAYAAVPEPASIALAGLGFGLLWLGRRRSKA